MTILAIVLGGAALSLAMHYGIRALGRRLGVSTIPGSRWLGIRMD